MDASSMPTRPPDEPDSPTTDNGGPADPRAAGPGAASGLDGSAIDTVFRSDAALRNAVTTQLRSRQTETQAIAERVDRAFAEFRPLPLSATELQRRSFVEPGQDVGEAQGQVIRAALDTLRTSERRRGITFRDGAGPAGGKDSVALEPLLALLEEKRRGTTVIGAPSAPAARAERAAEAIMAGIEQPPDANGAGPAAADAETASRKADQLVTESVDVQMRSATSPESRLEFGAIPTIPNHADDDAAQTRILETFELRPGASDVTAFHDFHTLQIAFPHVWTRIFDGELEALGRALYTEYVKLKDFGAAPGPDLQVGTLDDLRRLMAEIKRLSRTVEASIPDDLRGAGDGTPATGTKGSDDLTTPSRAASPWRPAA